MKATEKRTQIYLTAAQHRAAMALARRRGDSLAGVVRQALDRYLVDAVHDGEATWDGDPAYSLIGTLALPGRPPQISLSQHIDHTVYKEGPNSWSSPTAPGSSPRSAPRHGAHARAAAAWRQIAKARERLVTTQLVLAETVTYLRRRGGWEPSRLAGSAILHSPLIEVVGPRRRAARRGMARVRPQPRSEAVAV